MTHDGAKWVLEKNGDFTGTKFGPITIRNNSFIGVNSIVMPNVTVGPNSVVGAGSVVTKDVPPNTVYAGNPARFICTYEEYLEKCRLKNTGMIPRAEMRRVLEGMFEHELDQRSEASEP